MTIPNIITIARLLAVPVLVYVMLRGSAGAAFWIVLLAGLSDGLDGVIARHFRQQSRLGAWLDPIADKLLLVTTYVMLGVTGHLPDWLVILIVSRDVLIVSGVLLASLMGKPLKISPLFISKANTAAQVFLAVFVLAMLAFGFEGGAFTSLLILITAGLTILSAASYFLLWMRHMNGASQG
ncbi:CDP-alcohol phosphatidyltransferase family protein [Rhizobium sp. BK251]|uniref:CDP-alcohol phosphatidyltransferase family protein n=1 Tax=Rhizobium sp. BK251 TaxID=2512125 RepID=UPI00104E0897|nr:CDP-alcohol phosphatidyltransferase family protein [Rhizobium sp. BK251]TCL70268.1 cardiolipin synthase [Rhizobium sp. BK251]